MRWVLRGLRFADGAEAGGAKHGGSIFTSSARFRDEILQLAMHAGYSAYFKCNYETGTQHGVNKKGVPIIAGHDNWAVFYSDHPQKVDTLFRCTQEVKRRDAYKGNVWCVRVPTADRLIMTRKAKCNAEGRVNWATRPCVVGNCAFVTTEGFEKEDDKSKPFTFLMDASMLGVGVGFDTKGAGKLHVKGAHPTNPPRTYVIPDSREGWVEALRQLINAHVSGREGVLFDYSLIRPFGTPIKGFGGVASGPAALKELLDSVRTLLESRSGSALTLTDITDIMNLIGRCVVAGNVRRTAEIAFGSPESDEYLDLKNYAKNPQRADFGWTSNNSVFATLGMDYSKVCERVRANGEPGFAWLDNMQQYARMNGTVDARDHRVRGGNPCLEQSLESYELCTLVETFPNRHADEADFQRTLKFAYLYAKTVTLGKTHWPETNRVMLRNRRIGCSVSGVAQFISQHGLHELQGWLERGYNKIQEYDRDYSDWFAIPRSIKTTSVKPSGTVSLLAGATPGIHYPESRFYIRRMRLSAASELVVPLRAAGYPIEPARDGGAAANTVVVEIPVDVGEGVRTAAQVPMWEQLMLAAFMQRHWADNQVSCTVTFDPATEGHQLEAALDYFQYQLKGISFLPKLPQGAYPQMPYEAIDEAEYASRLAKLRPLDFGDARVRSEEANVERFCDGDLCSVDGAPSAGTGEAVPVDDVSADPSIATRPRPVAPKQ
jgi:adenosylcobalamin-dependent ribonucleoside-triphosphate reductase